MPQDPQGWSRVEEPKGWSLVEPAAPAKQLGPSPMTQEELNPMAAKVTAFMEGARESLPARLVNMWSKHGPLQALKGIDTTVKGDPYKGTSQVIRGAGTTLAPAVLPAAIASAPGATAAGLLTGALGQTMGSDVARGLGASEGQQDLAGDVLGLAAGGLGAKNASMVADHLPFGIGKGVRLAKMANVVMDQFRPAPTAGPKPVPMVARTQPSTVQMRGVTQAPKYLSHDIAPDQLGAEALPQFGPTAMAGPGGRVPPSAPKPPAPAPVRMATPPQEPPVPPEMLHGPNPRFQPMGLHPDELALKASLREQAAATPRGESLRLFRESQAGGKPAAAVTPPPAAATAGPKPPVRPAPSHGPVNYFLKKDAAPSSVASAGDTSAAAELARRYPSSGKVEPRTVGGSRLAKTAQDELLQRGLSVEDAIAAVKANPGVTQSAKDALIERLLKIGGGE